MATRIAGLVCALGGLLAVGCNHGEQRRLDEVAAFFHDDLRWGRLPAAEGVVDGRGRRAFLDHHRNWGERVSVMDLELASVRLRDDEGLVTTRVAWTRPQETDLRESVVEERWTRRDGDWRLLGERVISGDPALFAEEREEREEREGASRRASPVATSGGERPEG